MENEKWSGVLVDWVNCLKLGQNITNIDDLRDGEFFLNLQKVITKSQDVQHDSLTFIFDLFDKHYPHYSFKNKTEVHLSDLSSHDLKAIISLLMHYACMYDRRDVLTSPMCYDLPQTTQLIIRNYLEKTSKDVTNETMNGVIELCIKDASDHSTSQWLVINSSIKSSPLQEILKTPISKFGRLLEKDRIIAKLKSELESERYDRADLQEELKVAIDRNKKIEQQLLQKNTEILRLRADIEVLENITPPQCQDMDSRELQRRLRSEIESLEKYIKEIENEQEEMRKERDATKENLRKVEAQVAMWQEGFFEMERNFENLSDHSKKQEEELNQLQEHCSELTVLLEEYKSKPNNDSTCFDTSIPTNDGKNLNDPPLVEDLACSVVEVQLRDAQKENEELRNQIERNEEISNQLKTSMIEVKTKLEITESSNVALKKQINDLELEKRNLVKQLHDVDTLYAETKTDVTILTQKLDESVVNFQEIEKRKNDIEKQLLSVLDSCANEKRHFKILENELNGVKTVSQKLQFELGDAVLEYQKAKIESDTLKNEIELLLSKQQEIEDTKIILEKRLFESQTCSQNLKIHLDELLLEKESLCNEINASKIVLEKLEIENFDLHSQVKEANDNISRLEETNDELKNQLAATEKSNEELEKQFREIASSLENLSKENGAYKMSLTTTQEEKETIEKQLLEVIDCLEINKKQVDSLKENQTSLEIQLSSSQAFSEALKTELEEVKDEYGRMRKEIESLDLEKQTLNEELCKTKNTIFNLEDDKNKSEKKIAYLEKELMETLHHGNLKMVNLQKDLKEYRKNLATMNRRLSNTSGKNAQLKSQLRNILVQLNQVIDERNQLISQKNEFAKEQSFLQMLKTELEEQHNKTKIALLQAQKEVECSNATSQNLRKTLEETRSSMLKIESDKKHADEKIIILEKELTKTSDYLYHSQSEVKELEKTLKESEKNLRTFIEERKNIKSNSAISRFEMNKILEENCTLLSQKANIEKQLSSLQKSTTELEDEYEKMKAMKHELRGELNEFRSAVLILQDGKKDLQKKVANLNEELAETRDSPRQNDVPTKQAEIELEQIKKEAETLNEENAHVKPQLVVTQLELSKIQEERHQLISKNNNFEKELSFANTLKITLENENARVKHDLLQLEREIEILNSTKQQLVIELDESRYTIMTLKMEKKCLEEKVAKYEKELVEISNSLSHHKLKEFEEELKQSRKEVKILKEQKKELECVIAASSLELSKFMEEREHLMCTKEELEKELFASQSLKTELEDEIDKIKVALLHYEKEIELSNDPKNTLTETQNTVLKLISNKQEEIIIPRIEHVKIDERKGDKLNEKLDCVLKGVNTARKVSEELKSQIVATQVELQRTQKERDNIFGKYTELEQNLKAQENELQKLQSEHQTANLNLSDLERENEELLLKIRNLETQNSHLSQEKRNSERTESQLTKRIKLLEQKADEDLMKLKSENEALTVKVLDYEEKYANLEEKLCEVVNNLLVSSKELEDSRKTNFAMEQDIGMLKMNFHLVTAEKEELEKEGGILKQRAKELEENLRDLQKQNKVLVSLNEEIEIQHKKNVKDLITEKEENEKRLEENQRSLLNELYALKINYKEMSELSEALKVESEELRFQYQKSKTDLETITEEKDYCSQQLKELRQKNRNIEMEISAMKEELDGKKEMEEEIAKLKNDMKDLEYEASSLKHDKCVLEKRIEIDEIVSSEIRDKMKSLEDTILDYEITISGLKKVVDSNLESLENMQEELSDRKNKEEDIIKIVSQKLGKNKKDDFKTFICNTFINLLEEREKFEHEISKLQDLIMPKSEVVPRETLFDTVYNKMSDIIQCKFKLEEDLEKTKKRIEVLEKPAKTEKENILGVSTRTNKSREDELKKENMMLKRKLVLVDNAKTNLEKVLKEVREKKNIIKESSSSSSCDALDKKVTQGIIKERDIKIERLENDDKVSVKELQNVRDAYGNIVNVNAKLETEIVNLRRKLEERNTEVTNMAHIKEAYERLLEDNNKVSTEIDTLKYKRLRDKEEFVRLLKEERDKNTNKETKRIQEIRSEYEGKLEKMKEKMLKLYREEVNKKIKTVKDGQSETTNLVKTVANLRSELFEADQKIQLLEMEKEMLKSKSVMDNVQIQTVSSISSTATTENRRASTLPRPSLTEEITYSRRASLTGIPIQTEDEEDLFSDKHLTDMKEGRCYLQSNCGNSNSRFSELVWRNSMVPPHLKSSYPAELQFVSPTRFKDEDIKSGNVEFEDSLCKLLPGEKQQRKKDFGTTSYKKPGPPTPSRNGGRLSLQGNEVHPIREHCEAKTPKKSTPSRIRALFTGRTSSTREENQTNATPNRGRRLKIFRRQK